MKIRSLITVLAVFFLLPFAFSENKTKEIQTIPSEYVYIQKALSGELIENSTGSYTLTLKGNQLDVVFFADQPERGTGQKELDSFFQSWIEKASNTTKPTTAFLNYSEFKPIKDRGVTPDVLVLSNPTFNKESDTITFEATPLHDHEVKQGFFERIVVIYDKE
ncbi:MAG: hypothetical protein S4CHLAM7_05130 [Chlamydiae bacterium]|nr:hypothetical protein [Chlamydiota bacterium]